MLTAVERDHLPGDRRRFDEIADRPAELGERRPAAERHGCALSGEIGVGLADALQHRPGADGVDPDARRKRLRQDTRRVVEARFAHLVGEIVRRRLQDALVDDVDDVALNATRQRLGEGLGEEDRRRGVDRHLAMPEFRIKRADFVEVERAGAVDEERRRAERLGSARNDRHRLGKVGKVRLDDRRPASRLDDVGGHAVAVGARCMAVDRHRPAIGGEVLDDRAADAASPSGDDGDGVWHSHSKPHFFPQKFNL